MKLMDEIYDYISYKVGCADDDFRKEISTEENKDYRRGFRAGVLFSYLRMKADMKDFDEQCKE